jgi:hypothetical protein
LATLGSWVEARIAMPWSIKRLDATAVPVSYSKIF